MQKYDHKKIEKKILNKDGRTAVFIDASNIYHSQKHLGFQIDFKKFLDYLKKETNLLKNKNPAPLRAGKFGSVQS